MGAHHWSPCQHTGAPSVSTRGPPISPHTGAPVSPHTGAPSGIMYSRGSILGDSKARASEHRPTRARSRSADKRPEAGTPRGPCGGAAGSGMGAHAHDGTFLAVRRNYSAGDSGKHHAERERPRAEATRPGRPPAPSSRAGPETASAFRSAAMAGRGVGGTASGRSVPGRRGVSELGRVGARHCGRPRATARFRATWRILRRATGPFTEKAECGERATSTTVRSFPSDEKKCVRY